MTRPLPLHSLRPAQLLGLASLLLLSACSDRVIAPLPAPAPDQNVTEISGQVTSWSEPGTFFLVSSTGTPLAEAPLEESGAFELTLPAVPDADPVSPAEWLQAWGCSGDLVASSDARVVAATGGLATSAFSGRPVLASELTAVPGDHTTLLGQWVYAEEPVRLTGTLNCQGVLGHDLETPTTVDVDLNTGWNMVGTAITLKLGFKGLSAAGTINETGTLPTRWTRRDEVVARSMP